MNQQERTWNGSLSANAHAVPYRCLVEDADPQEIDLQKTRTLAKLLLEQYTGQTRTLKKWRSHAPFTIPWVDSSSNPSVRGESARIWFDGFVRHLIQYRGLKHSEFNLCAPEQAERNWMDAHVTVWGHYMPCNQEPSSFGIRVPLALGSAFPVAPCIDREGFATSSPQLHLQEAVIKARERVILESPSFVPQVLDREKGQQAQFVFSGTPPLAALMEFTGLYVSIVDITLMQAYYAGRYAASETGLTFRESAMGPATGRRVSDKLRWVSALTGKHLNAADEIEAFNELKAIRNHLAHFDPPCFAASIDDVAAWLSSVSSLGWLLIKIRTCLGVPISGALVRMAMAPRVKAVPRDPAHPRHPQAAGAGYASSTWGREHPHRGRDPLRVSERLIDEIETLRARVNALLGREFTIDGTLDAVLAQRLQQLASMDDAGLLGEIGNSLERSRKR